MPYGFSPQLFNIEIKKNVGEEHSHTVSPLKFRPVRRLLKNLDRSSGFKIKAMKAPKNYDPFSEIIKR